MELLKALRTLCCEDIKEVPAPLMELYTHNKTTLKKLLGGQEIYTTEINLERPVQYIRSSLRDLFFDSDLIPKLIKIEWWERDYVEDPYFAKLAGVSIGTKTMKAVKKLMINVPEKYEKLCVERSKINNDRFIRGNLNLSIHPIDYLTLSDNKNNWSSCLSIRNYGCYRAGCLEALTSPYLLVAYFTEKDATPANYYPPRLKNSSTTFQWNTKRYRSLVVFDAEKGVVCGKTYPHRPLEEWDFAILNTIRELAAQNLGVTLEEPQEYTEMYYLNDNKDIERAGTQERHRLLIQTDALYNDWLNANYTFYCAYTSEEPDFARINISGRCCCARCGEEVIMMDYDSDSDEHWEYTNEVLCQDCLSLNYCEVCGGNNGGYYHTKITYNNHKVCRKCWNEGKEVVKIGENHYGLLYQAFQKNQLSIVYYGEDIADAPSLFKLKDYFYFNTVYAEDLKTDLKKMKIDIVEPEKVNGKPIKISAPENPYWNENELESLIVYHDPNYIPAEDYTPTHINPPSF